MVRMLNQNSHAIKNLTFESRRKQMNSKRGEIAAAGLVIAFVCLVLYSRAHAQEAPIGPPPQGSYVTIRQPMIQCDTQDQIKQIAAAMLVSDKAAAAKIDEY